MQSRANTAGLMEEVRRLADVCYSLAYRYEATDELWSSIWEEDPELFAAVHEQLEQVRNVYLILSTEQRMEVLLNDGVALVARLREPIAVMARAYAFAKAKAFDKKYGGLVVPAEAYSARLERLSAAVSKLTRTHATVHEHSAAFGNEYWVKQTVRSMADESERYEMLNEHFYSELFDARDAFFLDGSSTNLERYVAVAEELAVTEHPLAAALDLDLPYIASDPTKRVRAAELLDSLSVGSLMTPLLTDVQTEAER